MVDRGIIKKQAKFILDKFSKALEKVKITESRVERKQDRRAEKEGKDCDNDFRDIMFKNAAKKQGDFIQGEKGDWI